MLTSVDWKFFAYSSSSKETHYFYLGPFRCELVKFKKGTYSFCINAGGENLIYSRSLALGDLDSAKAYAIKEFMSIIEPVYRGLVDAS